MPHQGPAGFGAPTSARLEVEVKARLADLSGWDEKLRLRGCFEGERLLRDTYFGPADVPPAEVDPSRHPVFRLRSVGDSHRLTYKDKRISEGVEVSREVEFRVDDPAAFGEFASRLGFTPFVEKTKRVWDYRIDGLTVQLVELEGLGQFIEIEHLGPEGSPPEEGRRRVLALLSDLGVSEEAVEPLLYIDLLRGKGTAT